MYHIYFDESKFMKANFVIGAFVFCREDPATFISQTLKDCGYDKSDDEFKSGHFYKDNPRMGLVREKLKTYLYKNNAHFGIVILPHSNIEYLGRESLKALKQFLMANNMSELNRIYFDQGIFISIPKALEEIKLMGLENNEFYLEQDSKVIKGIQLADLCSHCLTTMLREALGDLNKMVKNPEGSGYDPERSIKIGFDIWCSIRYSFLANRTKTYIEGADQVINFTFDTEPFGLFISEYCSEELAEKTRETFGTVYLGCIH
jgi:hypothetical protein